MANQEVVRGEACWPVAIKIDGFRTIANEVVFLDCLHDEDDFEPLLGYVILGQAQAAVDMLGHCLVAVRYIEMKQARPPLVGAARPSVRDAKPGVASGCP